MYMEKRRGLRLHLTAWLESPAGKRSSQLSGRASLHSRIDVCVLLIHPNLQTWLFLLSFYSQYVRRLFFSSSLEILSICCPVPCLSSELISSRSVSALLTPSLLSYHPSYIWVSLYYLPKNYFIVLLFVQTSLNAYGRIAAILSQETHGPSEYSESILPTKLISCCLSQFPLGRRQADQAWPWAPSLAGRCHLFCVPPAPCLQLRRCCCPPEGSLHLRPRPAMIFSRCFCSASSQNASSLSGTTPGSDTQMSEVFKECGLVKDTDI